MSAPDVREMGKEISGVLFLRSICGIHCQIHGRGPENAVCVIFARQRLLEVTNIFFVTTPL